MRDIKKKSDCRECNSTYIYVKKHKKNLADDWLVLGMPGISDVLIDQLYVDETSGHITVRYKTRENPVYGGSVESRAPFKEGSFQSNNLCQVFK